MFPHTLQTVHSIYKKKKEIALWPYGVVYWTKWGKIVKLARIIYVYRCQKKAGKLFFQTKIAL